MGRSGETSMWKSVLLPLLAAMAPTASARAADEINVSKGATLAGPGLAAHGYDVVAFFMEGKPIIGSDAHALAHDGGTYRFASQANLDTFKANHSRYEPAYGGFCAYGTALGKKFDGDPCFWKIVDGRLYLNLNGDIQAQWSKDIAGNITKADSYWQRIRTVAVDKL
jgi:YHS domain-containing protein